uniref:Uncharacterized protein n=1 Tax=Hucho hucho TaxID=62062 RepID=A0A4W5LL38_9TELE
VFSSGSVNVVLSLCVFFYQLVLIIGLTQALVVFRVVAAVLLSEGTWEFVRDHANTLAVMLGAVLHYFTMQVMTRVNKAVAFKLCEIGESEEEHLNLDEQNICLH